MIRNGTAANAVYAGVFVTPGSGVFFQRRTSAGGSTSTTTAAGIQAPIWLKLVRQGNLFSTFYSADGNAWTSVGTATVTMPGGVEVGLAVTAKDNTKVTNGVFDNVSMTGSEITAPPPAPTGLAAVIVSSTQISLTWSAANTATSYTVKRGGVSGGPYTTIATNVVTTPFLDSGLTEGASYYYVVSASNIIGESANSSPVGLTLTGATASTVYPVEDPTHASYGGGSTLDSNNAGFNGTGFINFSTTGGFLQFVNVDGGGGGNAAMNIRYALGASARTGMLIVNGVSQAITFDGTGAWTTWVNKTVALTLNYGAANTIRFESNGQDLGNIDEISVAPSPSAPATLTATGGSGQVALSWTFVSSASSYLVQRSTTSGSGFASIATPTTNSFTDTGLGDGVTCYYIVVAMNSSGSSPASAEATAATYSTVQNWRLLYFSTISNTGIAADDADPDGDGWTNAQEFSAGTNPNDRSSMLKVSEMVRSGNAMLVSFPTVTGKSYRLEWSATLQAGSWTTVQDNIAGTGGTLQVSDAGGAAQPQRFYRIIVQ